MEKRNTGRLLRRRRRRGAGSSDRKGLYAALAVCIAAIGAVAAVVFGGGTGGAAVEHSGDERLGDAAVTVSPAGSAAPALTALPTLPAPGGNKPGGSPAVSTPVPTRTPELTPAPSASPAPSEEPLVLTPPVGGEVIRIYAMDCLIYSKTLNQWMTHPGVDIAAPKGSEVRAVMEGTVESVSKDDMLGVTMVLSHPNGMRSVYASLGDKPPVTVGQKVESRAVIGLVGDTALSECSEQPHLHFELRREGSPIDPARYMNFPSLP